MKGDNQMDRWTTKDIESLFDTFLKASGNRKAEDYKDVGGMRLDHNSVYGGYVIEQIVNDAGAIRHPYGDRRFGPTELANILTFYIRAKTDTRKF
jgi:hypothetical protein